MGNEIPKEIGPTKDEKRILEEAGFKKQDNSFRFKKRETVKGDYYFVMVWHTHNSDKKWMGSITHEYGKVLAVEETYTLGHLLWKLGLETGRQDSGFH